MINYIIGGLVLVALFFAVRKLIRDRKNGGTCAGCTGCPHSAQCSNSH